MGIAVLYQLCVQHAWRMGNTLVKIGLKSKLETRFLIVGLDAAGKTTMLYKAKFGEIVTTVPTIGFNVETVEYETDSRIDVFTGRRNYCRCALCATQHGTWVGKTKSDRCGATTTKSPRL